MDKNQPTPKKFSLGKLMLVINAANIILSVFLMNGLASSSYLPIFFIFIFAPLCSCIGFLAGIYQGIKGKGLNASNIIITFIHMLFLFGFFFILFGIPPQFN